jgi:hypothetical protein
VADQGQRAYISWTDWSTGQGEGVMSTVKLEAFRFND